MKAERSAYWDNLKGILIILVVLGHFFYAYRSDEMIEMIVEVIYVFHMPVFDIFLHPHTIHNNPQSVQILSTT